MKVKNAPLNSRCGLVAKSRYFVGVNPRGRLSARYGKAGGIACPLTLAGPRCLARGQLPK